MQRYDPNYYDPNVIVEYDTDRKFSKVIGRFRKKLMPIAQK
jgi:hypothetical protein